MRAVSDGSDAISLTTSVAEESSLASHFQHPHRDRRQRRKLLQLLEDQLDAFFANGRTCVMSIAALTISRSDRLP